jgi:hypothetical protein
MGDIAARPESHPPGLVRKGENGSDFVKIPVAATNSSTNKIRETDHETITRKAGSAR